MTSRAPVNLRDIGGLPIRGGGRTAHGVVVRGDAPYDGDDLSEIGELPPTTVIDLRAPHERAHQPYPWPAGVAVRNHPLYDAGDLSRLPTDLTLVELYRTMLDVARRRIATVPAMIPVQGTVLIHCTAGKDRTGVVVAALLMLAGVDPEYIVSDYHRTQQAMPAVLQRGSDAGVFRTSEMPLELINAPRAAIEVVIDEISAWPGGARGWFLDHGATASALDTTISRLTSTLPTPNRRTWQEA